MIRLSTIPVFCVFLGCNAGNSDLFVAESIDRPDLDVRRATLQKVGCDPEDTSRVDGMEEALTLQNEAAWSVVSYLEPCGAASTGVPGENLVFDLDGVDAQVHGRLYFGTKAPAESQALQELWMFAFVGDREVTQSVFGGANLFVLPADGSAYSTEIELPSTVSSEGGMVSILLVDRLFATDPGDGRHVHFNRMFVNGTENADFPPSVRRVPSVAEGSDPFPQPVRFEGGPSGTLEGEAFLTFARGLETRSSPATETSVFPIDPVFGRRTDLECEGDAEGWIVTATPPGAPAGMACRFGDDESGAETVAVVLHDQFVIDPATGVAYVSIYLDHKLVYLDVRDQIADLATSKPE